MMISVFHIVAFIVMLIVGLICFVEEDMSMLETLGVMAILALILIYHTFLLGLVVGGWHLFVGLQFFHFIRTHPLETLLYVCVYFLVGALWSLWKWYLYEKDQVAHAREKFDVKTSNPNTLAPTMENWNEFKKLYRSNPKEHYEDFTIWITFWPISTVYYVVNDPIRRIVNRIVAELQSVYQRISDKVW